MWNGLDRYERKESKCETCPLNKSKQVWGEGSYHGRLVFLGEAPGAGEEAEGHPFVGRSGVLLNKMLKEFNLDRKSEWTMNTLSCRPPNNKFDSVEAKEALKKHCQNGLFEELDFLKRNGYTLIIALGSNACRGLDIKGKITQIHGNRFERFGFVVVPTFHPSYILRNGGVGSVKWYEWAEDFKKANEELLLEIV